MSAPVTASGGKPPDGRSPGGFVPGSIITTTEGPLLILAISQDSYVAAPVIPPQRKRCVGDVPAGDWTIQTGAARIVPGSPSAAEICGAVEASVLAQCLREAQRTAAERQGLRRFAPLSGS